MGPWTPSACCASTSSALQPAAGLPPPYPYLKEPPPNPDAEHLFEIQGPSLASTGLDMSPEAQDELLNLLNDRQQAVVKLQGALSLGEHCAVLMHAVIVGHAPDVSRAAAP
jgi:hypothetical protein